MHDATSIEVERRREESRERRVRRSNSNKKKIHKTKSRDDCI